MKRIYPPIHRLYWRFFVNGFKGLYFLLKKDFKGAYARFKVCANCLIYIQDRAAKSNHP